MNADRPMMRRWPLWLVAAPAAVAVWSGWVGLGAMCGFGVVHPLPGIVPGLRLDTAITLPVGVEAYGAYALGAWLHSGVSGPAKTFARRSALGALMLGMLGQVAYHLLAASGHVKAPWPVVVLVSCLPVVTLGFAASLTHLLRVSDTPAAASELHPASAAAPHLSASAGVAETASADAPPDAPPDALPDAPAPASVGALSNGHSAPERGKEAARKYGRELARGEVPSLRRITREMRCGQPKAQAIRTYLETICPQLVS